MRFFGIFYAMRGDIGFFINRKPLKMRVPDDKLDRSLGYGVYTLDFEGQGCVCP